MPECMTSLLWLLVSCPNVLCLSSTTMLSYLDESSAATARPMIPAPIIVILTLPLSIIAP